MTGGDELQDVLPGRYKYSDVFQFHDLGPVTPRFSEICGVQWKYPGTGKGILEFPSDFDVLTEMEVEVGTNEYVSY